MKLYEIGQTASQPSSSSFSSSRIVLTAPDFKMRFRAGTACMQSRILLIVFLAQPKSSVILQVLPSVRRRFIKLWSFGFSAVPDCDITPGKRDTKSLLNH